MPFLRGFPPLQLLYFLPFLVPLDPQAYNKRLVTGYVGIDE
jgi:hypothetical protein